MPLPMALTMAVEVAIDDRSYFFIELLVSSVILGMDPKEGVCQKPLMY